MVEYDFSRAAALETGEPCAVSPFGKADIVDRDVLRSELLRGSGTTIHSGSTELLLLSGNRLALCTDSGELICPVFRGPKVPADVKVSQSSIVVEGIGSKWSFNVDGMPSVIRHWAPIFKGIFGTNASQEAPNKYLDGLGISLSSEKLIPCMPTSAALNTAGSRTSVTTGFESEISQLLSANPALELMAPSVPWSDSPGDVTPSPNSLYISGEEETPKNTKMEQYSSEKSTPTEKKLEKAPERPPPIMPPPVPEPTEVPEMNVGYERLEKPKLPAAATENAPSTPTSLNSVDSQSKLPLKVRKSFQTMIKRLRKPKSQRNLTTRTSQSEPEHPKPAENSQNQHRPPSPNSIESSKETDEDSIKTPIEKHQRTESAGGEVEKPEVKEDVSAAKTEGSNNSKAPEQLPSIHLDRWDDISLDNEDEGPSVKQETESQPTEEPYNVKNSTRFGSNDSGFVTASESDAGSAQAVSFDSHNRTVEIGASKFSSQSSGLSSLSFRSHKSQKSHASKASSTLETLPEADEVPDLIADSSVDSQFSDFLASVRSKARLIEQQKENEEMEKRRAARIQEREKQTAAAVIAYENARAVSSVPNLERPMSMAAPSSVPPPRPVAPPMMSAKPIKPKTTVYPTLDPKKLDSLPPGGRKRLSEVSMNASTPALNYQPNKNTLFAGAMWVSRWTFDRWTPLSQLELDTQVAVTDRNSSRIFVMGPRGTSPTVFRFGRRSSVRRVGAHDIEVRIIDGETYMFRSRDPERARQFFASLATLQGDARDSNQTSKFRHSNRESVVSSTSSSSSIDNFETWRRRVAPPPLAKPRFLRTPPCTIIEE